MSRFITPEKLDLLFEKLESLGLDLLYLSDSESHRDVNMKYITGHPEDASLFLDVRNRQTVLIPWDYQISKQYSEVNQLVNMSDFEGGVIAATIETLKDLSRKENPKIGVPKDIPYYYVRLINDQLPAGEIIYDPNNIDNVLDKLRETKSPFEIKLIQESFKISNTIVDNLEEKFQNSNNIKTEMDLATYVENRMRHLGAMSVGFETLVASSARSWQIHTYPRAHPTLQMNRPGLALIDFGVNAKGLTSDVTLPFVFGKMNEKMKKIVETVQQAHDESVEKLKEALYLHEVAEVASSIIERAGYSMPHSLGHGIGLTVHDSPFVRKKPTHEALLKSWEAVKIEQGMIITIEPGIYEQDVGGFRLENDVVITSKGPEIVTNSRPLFIN
ncbi:MAG: M24 family metallopeptidase [Candidatus Heimdallarchaeota archaeon]|nr:M24 family metallopeptidase [Candidatus Heimdallarchaeota archaeon]